MLVICVFCFLIDLSIAVTSGDENDLQGEVSLLQSRLELKQAEDPFGALASEPNVRQWRVDSRAQVGDSLWQQRHMDSDLDAKTETSEKAGMETQMDQHVQRLLSARPTGQGSNATLKPKLLKLNVMQRQKLTGHGSHAQSPTLALDDTLYATSRNIKRSTSLVALFVIVLWFALPARGRAWSASGSKGFVKQERANATCATSHLHDSPQILKDLIVDCKGDFLRSTDGRLALTYEQLREFLSSEEAALQRFGIGLTDRVALLLKNEPELVVALFAFTSHCSVYPMDPAASDEEVAFVLADLPAKSVVALQEHSSRVKSSSFIQLEPDPNIAGLFSLSATVRNAPVPPILKHGRQDVALLLHTSGSTKKPKLVPLTHENLLLGAMCIRDTLDLKASDTCLNMMPLFHIGGISCNILATAAASASVICAPHFNGSDGLTWIKTFRPSWYYAGPTFHILLMSQKEKPAGSSLQFVRSGSAALLPSVGRQMQTEFGCLILPTYSMTECMPVCSHHRYGLVNLASVGPSAAPTLRLNADGEVCISGPCVTKGYEVRAHMDKNPNEDAFDENGWMRTGDVGTMDASGYVFLQGRSKEIIVRGGENISPLQVEEAFRAVKDSRVQDIVVFSSPHEQLGEEVAVAVKAHGVKASQLVDLLTQLNSQASSSIPQRFFPKVIVQFDEFLKGRTGKVMRIGLAHRLGLPSNSATEEHGDRLKAFTYFNQHLTAVEVVHNEGNVVLDSMGIARRGRLVSDQKREVVLAAYSIMATLVVVDHMAAYFGYGLVVFPSMPPWAVAVLEVVSRNSSEGWRLNCLVMCTAYLNAFEDLQGIRLIVQISSYLLLNSAFLSDFSAKLSCIVAGKPTGSCGGFPWTIWFLKDLIICQVLFALGRRFPLPSLQCIVAVAYTAWIWAEMTSTGKVTDSKWFHGAQPTFVAIYLVVGHYGHTFSEAVSKHPAWQFLKAKGLAAISSGVILFGMFYMQVRAVLPTLRAHAALVDIHEPLGSLVDSSFIFEPVGSAALAFADIREVTVFRNLEDAMLDIVHSFIVMCLLVTFLSGSGLAPWLSGLGQFSWGIFAMQGMLFYCAASTCPLIGPCQMTWGITIRGHVIIPYMQSAIDATSFSGCLQLILIAVYALVMVACVCVPYQLLHIRVVRLAQYIHDKIFALLQQRYDEAAKGSKNTNGKAAPA